MPYPVDPASLEGDELEQWYRRSPHELADERQAAEAQRYQEFFGQPYADSSGAVPIERIEAPHIDTDSLIRFPTLPPDVGDQAGTRPSRSTTDSPPRSAPPYARHSPPVGANPAGQSTAPARRPVATVPTMPPPPSFFSYLFGGPVPLHGPGDQVVGYYDHQAAKAGLGITAQYAAIAPLFHPAGWMDSMLGESSAVLPSIVRRAATSPAAKGPLNFAERELWQGKEAVGQIGERLDDAAKTALRRMARERIARSNGISASAMNAQVHHSTPLEYAHLLPNADPNRLATLWPLIDKAHQITQTEWTAFRQALGGRIPTQAEIMAAKLRIDRMVAPYLQRAGVSRPGPPVK